MVCRNVPFIISCTVNWGDFGQIYTIFIDIFIMMNWIKCFTWGLVSTMYVWATHIIYALNSSWLLHSHTFTVKPGPKSPWSLGWLWTPKHMVFQSNTASRIQNEIVCDLFGTTYKLLTQTVPFVIKPVDVRLNCSFPPNLWKVWPLRNWLMSLVYFCSETINFRRKLHKTNIIGMPPRFSHRDMYIAPSSGHTSFNFNMPFKLLLRRCEGCFLMFGVKIYERLMEIHILYKQIYKQINL